MLCYTLHSVFILPSLSLPPLPLTSLNIFVFAIVIQIRLEWFCSRLPFRSAHAQVVPGMSKSCSCLFLCMYFYLFSSFLSGLFLFKNGMLFSIFSDMLGIDIISELSAKKRFMQRDLERWSFFLLFLRRFFFWIWSLCFLLLFFFLHFLAEFFLSFH